MMNWYSKLLGKKEATFGTVRRHDRKVVIETPWDFTKQIWTDALNQDCRGWQDRVDLEFVSRISEHPESLHDADVACVVDLSQCLLDNACKASWIHCILAGVNRRQLSKLPQAVQVTNSSGIAAHAMAEHALMYYLSLRNNLPTALRKQTGWIWDAEGLLSNPPPISSQIVLVVGLGQAGRAIASLFMALGCRVIGVSNHASAEFAACSEVRSYESLNQLLPLADLVVLSASLKDDTRGLISGERLTLMKPTAVLVNVARGALVDEAALADALNSGMIAGAGLDVLSQEPPARRHPLRKARNLILTPHTAGNVSKFRREIASRFAGNLASYLQDAPLQGSVRRQDASR